MRVKRSLMDRALPPLKHGSSAPWGGGLVVPTRRPHMLLNPVGLCDMVGSCTPKTSLVDRRIPAQAAVRTWFELARVPTRRIGRPWRRGRHRPGSFAWPTARSRFAARNRCCRRPARSGGGRGRAHPHRRRLRCRWCHRIGVVRIRAACHGCPGRGLPGAEPLRVRLWTIAGACQGRACTVAAGDRHGRQRRFERRRGGAGPGPGGGRCRDRPPPAERRTPTSPCDRQSEPQGLRVSQSQSRRGRRGLLRDGGCPPAIAQIRLLRAARNCRAQSRGLARPGRGWHRGRCGAPRPQQPDPGPAGHSTHPGRQDPARPTRPDRGVRPCGQYPECQGSRLRHRASAQCRRPARGHVHRHSMPAGGRRPLGPGACRTARRIQPGASRYRGRHGGHEATGLLDGEVGEDVAICVYQQNWHQGVIGIVAGRMRERYHRPAIVFADAGTSSPGDLKGSARSMRRACTYAMPSPTARRGTRASSVRSEATPWPPD